ncbi:hypothetical protein [Clostridium sp. C105KSO13]|uniref:hypothetical protein n=1 Tax=Clostridium sp. C105KSO13 TaxID=1776045 RepID=UPI0007406C5D|nr:hypothetical protein [Clostridium sp. C105KSO13]CUX25528.1 hypothetical protein BN3456_00826 [Clostridium sp. C105KSO13]
MPKPLFTKLVAQGAIGFFCVLIGCIYSIHTHDRIFLMLSLLIGLCSIIRFFSLYRMIRRGHFITIEGKCQKREPSMFKKNQQILLLTEDGQEFRFSLDKSVKILQGHHYRLYFQSDKSNGKDQAENLSNALQDFLGFEELTSVDSKKPTRIP